MGNENSGLWAGLAAAGSAVGSLAKGISQKRAQKREHDFSAAQTEKQNAYNREMTEYGYSQDKEQWDRTNEYNSPTATMARLKAAGLNPNLVYGNGAKTQAQQLPKYQAPTADFSKVKSPNFSQGENINQGITGTLGAYQDTKQQVEVTNSIIRAQELTQQKTLNEALKGIEQSFKNVTSKYEAKKAQDNHSNWLEIQSRSLDAMDAAISKQTAETEAIGTRNTGQKTQNEILAIVKDMKAKELSWMEAEKWLKSIGAGADIIAKAVGIFK